VSTLMDREGRGGGGVRSCRSEGSSRWYTSETRAHGRDDLTGWAPRVGVGKGQSAKRRGGTRRPRSPKLWALMDATIKNPSQSSGLGENDRVEEYYIG
jgi:hypothetical protein